jgi:thymidylate synthase (FAD)
MRICHRPRVYLVAKSVLHVSGVEDFLADQRLAWPTEGLQRSSASDPLPAEQLTELAGRCCYMSFGKKAGSKTNAAYLDNLLGRTADGGFRDGPAHGSVLEHANFSFLVVGAGRGFSHEQVRHRAGWAYSQLSTRYCDFERDEEQEGTWDPGFTVPPLGQLDASTQEAIEQSHRAALDAYKRILVMIEHDLQRNAAFMAELARYPEKEQRRMLRKAARGAARDVLPNGTEAIMVMTANARAIWNTIYLRASEHAEAEIRDVYVQIARIMEQEMPNVFKGMQFTRLWDGSEAVMMPRDKI